MFKFFDFIYYSIYKAYANAGEEDIPSLYAIGILTIFQFFALFSMTTIIHEVIYKDYLRIEKWWIIAFGSVILITNLLRLYFIGKSTIIEYWNGSSHLEIRKMKRITLLAYAITIILTVVSFLI
jgi:hypothetical protein